MIYEKLAVHHIVPAATIVASTSSVKSTAQTATSTSSGTVYQNVVDRVPLLNKAMIDQYYTNNVLPFIGTFAGTNNKNYWQALLLALSLGQEIAVLSY